MSKLNRRYEEAVNTFAYFLNKLDVEAILTDEYLRIEWMNRNAHQRLKKSQSYIYRNWHHHLFSSKDGVEPCKLCREILVADNTLSELIDVKSQKKNEILQASIFPLNLPLWDTRKFLIILINITEKEKANREIRTIQGLMTQALTESGDAFFLVDNKNRIKSWNMGAEIIFGYSEEEIIGSLLSKIIPMDAFETFNVEQKISGDHTTQRIKKFETYGLNNQNKKIAIDLTQTETYDAKDKLQSISIFVKDVSPKKVIREQLRRIIQQFYKLNELNEHLYRTLDLQEIIRIILLAVTAESGMDFDQAFLLMRTPDEKIIRVEYSMDSKAANGRSGLFSSKEQTDFFEIMMRTHWGEFNHNDLKKKNELSDLVIKTNDETHIVNYVIQRRKALLIRNGLIVDPGKYESINGLEELIRTLQTDSFVLIPLVGKQKIIGLLIADKRVSQKEIALEEVEMLKSFSTQASLAYENAELYSHSQLQLEELREAYRQLREQQEKIIHFQKLASLGEMSAKIAHEIRNPLVSMGGLAKAIADKSKNDKKIHRFAQTIFEQALNLENILENLLNLAAPGPLKKRDIKVRSAVKEILRGIKSSEMCRSCEFVIDIHEEMTIVADPVKIRQVFTNLIRNALQAIGENGQLEIFSTMNTEENRLEIHFRDNGPGVDPENTHKLFEPFYTTKSDGSGLGLSISNQIMNQHGGAINIQNGIEGGADFVLLFPLKEK